MSVVQGLSVLVFYIIIGLTVSQNRWMQSGNFGHHQPYYPQPQRFPYHFPQFNFPQQNSNGRFMGFNRFRTNYHAATPHEPAVNNPDAKINLNKPQPVPPQDQQENQKRSGVQVDATDTRLSDSNTSNQIKATAAPIDPCQTVVCPRGTLCEIHPSQCGTTSCPQYAVCTVIQAAESCKDPKVVGTCSYKYDSFFFNAESGRCEPFVYTGCGGNNNIFSTLKQCQQVCVPSKKLCELGRETGPCRAAKPRWYYKQATETCEEFIYGGCRGNSNNFKTREDCLTFCSA